jgi:hypothetical protein
MAKQPATISGKTPATEVEGHKIQKPRLLDAAHDREVTAANDVAIQRISDGDKPDITTPRGPNKDGVAKAYVEKHKEAEKEESK